MGDDAAGAVRRTPNPPRTDDHQTLETAAPGAPGTTNPGTPVSQDAGNATGELSAFEAACLRSIDDDAEAYAALPECLACGGSGKDDHATAFEAPLAVHFAGPPVKAEGRRRQLCMWCGHVLRDVPSTPDAPPPWPDGALVRVEDGLGEVVPYEPGAELPPGCCALPDDDTTPCVCKPDCCLGEGDPPNQCEHCATIDGELPCPIADAEPSGEVDRG